MSQARADLRILSSPGSYVGDYLQAFARVRQSCERVSASMRHYWSTARQAARHARPRQRTS
jgi:hypothetical protein